MPEFVWVIDKSMQSFKKIYLVVMKLNQFFALHFFANGLYYQMPVPGVPVHVIPNKNVCGHAASDPAGPLALEAKNVL